MMRNGAVCFERAVLIFFFFSVSLTFLSAKSTFYSVQLCLVLINRKETDRSNFSLRFHIRLLLAVWAKTMLYQVLDVLRNLSRSSSNFLLSET